MPFYSIDDFSLLLATAATIGLNTGLAFTFTHAVLPLAIALFSAGPNSSLFVTNSPWPPKPSNILWKGISLKSVATLFPL